MKGFNKKVAEQDGDRGGDSERDTCCRKAFAFYRGAFFTLMESLMGNIGTLVVLASSRSCCSRGSVGFYKISGTSGIVREMQWLFLIRLGRS
jgi:hypothetical protein